MALYRGCKRRIAKVKRWFATCPIPQRVVDDAFEEFRHEGELPEDERLAALVCAKAGYHDTPTTLEGLQAAVSRILVRAAERGETDAETELVRDALFDEALYGPDVVKRWARVALRVLVCRGGDVTSETLGTEHGLPEFGAVGMHVLGHPRRLAKAPYEEQGNRLFDRYDEIRRRMDRSPDDDFEPLAEAFLAFEERGELPADGLLRDYELAEFEIEMLQEHRASRDVAEVMARLDTAATGEEGEAAVAAVQRFVLHSARG